MLNDEERAILDFERAWWRFPGPKDEAIEMTLGLTAESYYELLRGLVATPAAMAADPLTTRRVLGLIERVDESEMAV